MASKPARLSTHVPAYAWYALFVFVLVYIINFIDRQILAILVGDIKRDLGVKDAEIGFLYGTAFAVFYSLFGIPLGRLADGWYRGRLMACGLALWSSMTMLSGFATNFTMLAAARIGVGIGEASASPAAYSMIADYFRKERRGTAISIYASGLYIGGGVSLLIGGLIVGRWTEVFPDPAAAPFGLAGWQAAFIAVGLPGLLLVPWVLSLREPPRGAFEPTPEPVRRPGVWGDFGRELLAIIPPFTLLSAAKLPGGEFGRNLVVLALVGSAALALIWLTGSAAQWGAYAIGVYGVYSWTRSFKHKDPAAYALIWGSPTFLLLLAVVGALSFVNYGTKFWLPYFAEQTFYPTAFSPSLFLAGAIAKEEVGAILGWSNALSAGLGVVLGGYLSDRWKDRDDRGRLFVCMISAVGPLPFIALMLTTDDALLFYLANPVAQMFASAWVGAIIVSLQELVTPALRAVTGATYILASTMLGLALGPYFVGRMSEASDSLSVGIAALYSISPLSLLGLWIVSKRIGPARAAT